MFRTRIGILISLSCTALLVACTGRAPTPEPTATAVGLPDGAKIELAPAGVQPAIPNTTRLSKTYNLAPSGPLAAPVEVTLPLTSVPTADTGVVVATAETAQGPWTLVSATVSSDRHSVKFTTDHFSLFSTLGVDLQEMFKEFKNGFVDPLTSAVTAEASKPNCANENGARGDGYGISSSSGSTVYWCLGLGGSTRRLTVVNNRRYPLEIYHHGIPVISSPSFFSGALQDIEPGDAVVLAPRESVTLDVTLAPGGSRTLNTEFDGFAQALYSLYIGVDTLVSILTRFGFGDGPKTAVAVGTLLQSTSCLHALKGGPVEVLAHCFDMADLYRVFGWKGIALSELMVFSSLINFFHSQFNVLGDQFNSRDRYSINVTRQASASPGNNSVGGGNPESGGSTPPPPPPNRTNVVSYDQMRGGAPYWGRSSKGWQGFTAASNTITVVGVTWNDNNYSHGATLPGVTTRISLCTGVGSGSDPCVGRIADGIATVNNTADTRIDFGDIAVTRGATYYVFYYQPTVDAGNWDLYWWNCPACPGTGRQSALNSDQNQIIVLGYNR